MPQQESSDETSDMPDGFNQPPTDNTESTDAGPQIEEID